MEAEQRLHRMFYRWVKEKQAVWCYRHKPLWCGSLLCLLVFLGLQEHADAQGNPPRRRNLQAPTVSTPSGNPATAQPPQPLSPDTKIGLDQNGLSVDVQEQDLPSVIERIATLGQIDIRHPEGIPNRRVSIRFSSLPVVDGLKRLLRVAEVPGYVLVTAQDSSQVQRIVFLTEEGTGSASTGRGFQRAPQVAAAAPPLPRPGGAPLPPGAVPPGAAPPPPGVPPSAQTGRREEPRGDEARASGNVFDDIKSNAAARRLLSQMMHPNEQVRERAFEGLVRLLPEDDKQRSLMEFLEPLMDDLGADDQATQDGAREEIRKLLIR